MLRAADRERMAGGAVPEPMHPDIVCIPEGGKPYRFWMINTPYPSANDAYGNPSKRLGSPARDENSRAVYMSTPIVITSQNQVLLDLCRSFIPQGFPIIVIDGTDGVYGIEAIIHVVENVPHDRVILLDEDAFILDAVRLTRLLTWAANDGAACIGMSDGGVVPIRRHNPNVLNPFFNILDLAAIRSCWNKAECLSFAGRPIAQELLPPKQMLTSPRGYVFDEFEKYYCFYFWLHAVGFRMNWLSAETHIDDVSTLLHDHNGQPFLLHTWYAREFSSRLHRARITHAAEWAARVCNRSMC